LLPQLWFRNTWSWKNGAAKLELTATNSGAIAAKHPELGGYQLHFEGRPELLFCDNETNVRRLYGQDGAQGYFKDAFHEYVIAGNKAAVNPRQTGTKAPRTSRCPWPRGAVTIRLRLRRAILAKPSQLRKLSTWRCRDQRVLCRPASDIADADRACPTPGVRRHVCQAILTTTPEWIRGDANSHRHRANANGAGTVNGRTSTIRHFMPDKGNRGMPRGFGVPLHPNLAMRIPSHNSSSTREWYITNGQLPA
jgi:hypothetical protein